MVDESIVSTVLLGQGHGAFIPNQTKCTHANRLQIRVSVIKRRSENKKKRARMRGADFPYLEVISNVVPKIWARTNSAMLDEV
jgi:hypothetical protein